MADTLRFRLKLAIGEDAYASLRVGKALGRLWDVGGVAATGAGVAASPVVAGAFFGATGFWASLGLGAAAATPIGWIAAAAFVSGTAYYGVTRALRGYAESRVEVIPKFINSPIDELGAALFDMIGALSLKVARMDGAIDAGERAAIIDYMVAEWGYDRAYAERALALLEENTPAQTIKAMAAAIASFVAANPDCNFEAFRAELLTILQEVAQADGILDEREELAIEAIGRAMRPPGLVDTTVDTARRTAEGVGSVTAQIANGVGQAGSSVAQAVSRLAGVLPHLPFRRKE
ncbi:MAG: TerB family tellurite resistance protein [Gemmobacter sp.]